MATTNAVGPQRTNPGRVKPNGVNKLENAGGSGDSDSFSLGNGSATILSGTGALKLEWRAEGLQEGARFGVFLAPSVSTDYRYIGEIEYRRKSNVIPTFNSAASLKAQKTKVPVQLESLEVSNAIMQFVDGGAFIQMRIQPRNGMGAIITAAELTYTS